MVLLSVIVLVAVLVGPAGAQSVYQDSAPAPAYPVFEVNAQTEAHPATTWAEKAAQRVATLAATSAGRAIQVALGLYNVLVNKEMPLTQASINF